MKPNDCSFERQLKDKLIQKAGPRTTEEACLVKIFKFIDLQDKGRVNFAQFAAALEKVGMYFPAKELLELFNDYDVDNNGFLDYREFTLAVYGRSAAGQGTCQKPTQMSAEE